jgi:hypothetical protein
MHVAGADNCALALKQDMRNKRDRVDVYPASTRVRHYGGSDMVVGFVLNGYRSMLMELIPISGRRLTALKGVTLYPQG